MQDEQRPVDNRSLTFENYLRISGFPIALAEILEGRHL
jgi:hypothetical protein